MLAATCLLASAGCSDEGYCYEPVFGAASVGDIENGAEGVTAIVSWKSDPHDQNGDGFYTEAHVFIDETQLDTDFYGARAEVVRERQIEVFVPQRLLDMPDFEHVDVTLSIAGCRYNDSYGVTLQVYLRGEPHARFLEVETTNVGACISIDRSSTRRSGRGSQWALVMGALLATSLVRRRARPRT